MLNMLLRLLLRLNLPLLVIDNIKHTFKNKSMKPAFTPAYIKTHQEGKLSHKVKEALTLLKGSCRVCPRYCQIDRIHDAIGVCKIGRYSLVSNVCAHTGEENVLRGFHGSGTIFFSGCNLKCVFCQNWDISQHIHQHSISPQRLAEYMMQLQENGCHNINFVTPEHVVPQIIEALPYAIKMGLRLPLVYNTGAYDSSESLDLMNGLIDIYMPDFKFFSSGASSKYLKAHDYPEIAKESIKEMHRQTGELVLDSAGIAQRGVLLRHLVMPGFAEDSKKILQWIYYELSPNTYVNIMAQYHPAYISEQYPEINRSLSDDEYHQVIAFARTLPLKRLDQGSIPSI